MPHHECHLNASDGLSLFAQAWLPDTQPRGGIVLVHGICEHSGRYAPLAAVLNQHGYAVYGFDLRGHGRSSGGRVAIRSFDEYISDAALFLNEVARKNPDLPLFLFGHSMGGAIAARLAIEQPPKVRGILLSAPVIRVPDTVFPWLRKLAPLAARICPNLRVTRLGCRYISRDEAVVEAFRNDPLVFHGRFPVRTGNEILRNAQQIRANAERIPLPLVIFHGTEDRAADPAGSRLLIARAGSSDKTLQLYEGFYHEVFSDPERKKPLADLIAWLDDRC